MNSIKRYFSAIVLSIMVCQPLLAAPAPPLDVPVAGEAVDAMFAAPEAVDYTLLGEQQMEETTGEVAFLVGAIIGVDLALMSFFWGIYVPNYLIPDYSTLGW